MNEIDLYDKKGRAKAYIASDGQTIYTWAGHAVAYLDDSRVYGWNGRHLGWWRDGIMYDGDGDRVGIISSRCPTACYAAPAKYAKYAQYAKHARHAAYAQRELSTRTSSLELDEFLRQGAVG